MALVALGEPRNDDDRGVAHRRRRAASAEQSTPGWTIRMRSLGPPMSRSTSVSAVAADGDDRVRAAQDAGGRAPSRRLSSCAWVYWTTGRRSSRPTATRGRAGDDVRAQDHAGPSSQALERPRTRSASRRRADDWGRSERGRRRTAAADRTPVLPRAAIVTTRGWKRREPGGDPQDQRLDAADPRREVGGENENLGLWRDSAFDSAIARARHSAAALAASAALPRSAGDHEADREPDQRRDGVVAAVQPLPEDRDEHAQDRERDRVALVDRIPQRRRPARGRRSPGTRNRRRFRSATNSFERSTSVDSALRPAELGFPASVVDAMPVPIGSSAPCVNPFSSSREVRGKSRLLLVQRMERGRRPDGRRAGSTTSRRSAGRPARARGRARRLPRSTTSVTVARRMLPVLAASTTTTATTVVTTIPRLDS